MNANRHASHRFLGSDLAAVAGHIIQPEEYEEWSFPAVHRATSFAVLIWEGCRRAAASACSA